MAKVNHALKRILLFASSIFLLSGGMLFAQELQNVPEAFDQLNPNPEIFILENRIRIPKRYGHLQGVQSIKVRDQEKIMISGSSFKRAFILQGNLNTGKTEKLITLMRSPFRHAGGIQISEHYLIAGIEDNFKKTRSQVCIYDLDASAWMKAEPLMMIDRFGEPKVKTAGATGLLGIDYGLLAVVCNWDSRIWDFYHLDIINGKVQLMKSIEAPETWGSYQSVNLLKDQEAIYAIGTYKSGGQGIADLIRISGIHSETPDMKLLQTKKFNCPEGLDFGSAAGIQVDGSGKLNIWATQRDGTKSITIGRYSQLQ